MTAPSPSDGELVRRARDGETAAFGELARRWSARMFAFCYARTGRSHVAEDLAQETLLRGLRALETLESPERFGPWLRGIAQRVFLDWRKAKQTSQVSLSSLGDGRAAESLLSTDRDAAERRVERDDETRRLMQAVESLDEEYRETIMLYYTQDVTYGELAALLDVSPATINARLTKARAALRERLGCEQPGRGAAGEPLSTERSGRR